MNRYQYKIINKATVIREEDFEARSNRAAKCYVTELGTVVLCVPAIQTWNSRWYTIQKDTLFEKKCPTHDVRMVLRRYRRATKNIDELTAFTFDHS